MTESRWGRRTATLVAMADTHRCPFCELVFRNVAELQAHIAVDHPEREVPERSY